MKIVLLFFCGVLGLILLIILLLISSTIKLNVERLNISNYEKGFKKSKIAKEFKIFIELHLFGKIKIAKIRINKKILKKLNVENDFKDLKKDAQLIKKVNILEILKLLKIKLEKLNLKAEIGTEDVMITVFLVTFISTVVGIICRNVEQNKVEFNIMPLYQFGNAINFRLNCIINVKVVHIIYVIYILLKKGMIKNERTSNRRSYDYSYE